jgi:cytochrome c-type biogenesis protein CcmF
MLAATLFSLGLLAFTGKKYKNESDVWEDASSKEFGYTLAIIILMICAVITGSGMSAPLITQGLVSLHLLGNQSSVQPSFYNKANFPVAVLLSIGMGLGPYLAWRHTSAAKLSRLQYVYATSVGLTAVAVAVAWKYEFNFHVPQLILLVGCLFALIANGQVVFLSLVRPAYLRAPIRTMGGHLAHIGAVCMLLGIICLVTFTRSDKPILAQGHSVRLDNLPYVMAYTGMTSTMKDPANDLKFHVAPADGGRSFTALMPMAIRNTEGQMKILARPSIFHKWWGDLYIALVDGPEELSPTPLQKFTLHKGQTSTVAGYNVTFVSFYVEPKIGAALAAGHPPRRFPVSALLLVKSPDGKSAAIDAQYITDVDNPVAETSPEVNLPVRNSRLPWSLAFTGMDITTSSADFYIRDASVAPVEAYTISVSTRPGIGLVWMGTVLIAFGGLLSMRRRIVENKLTPPGDPGASSALGDDVGVALDSQQGKAKAPSLPQKPIAVAVREVSE